MDDRAWSTEVSGLRAWAEELIGQFGRLRAGTADLRAELAAITATARSADGYVTAVVGPRGNLVRLTLDPRIYRRPDSHRLASTITETIQRAADEAAAAVTRACAPYLPEDDVRAHLRFDVDGAGSGWQGVPRR